MQYFVATEDSRDFRWRTELLLESIRLLGLEDQTVVAVCPGPGIKGKTPYPNQVKFDNIGRKLGYQPINKSLGLLKALEQGVLRQPFVVLDTDMFLLRPIPQNFGDVSAQIHARLEWEHVKPVLGEHVSGSDWVAVGGVYQFNGAPGKVFEDIYTTTYDLFQKVGPVPDLHTFGFTLGVSKNDFIFTKRDDYEMPLKKDDTPKVNWGSHVVHYSKGHPPYFSKEKAFDSIDFAMTMPLPFKKILEAPVLNQPNMSLMQTLVRSWLSQHANRLGELMF